jgi:hypothetical protein
VLSQLCGIEGRSQGILLSDQSAEGTRNKHLLTKAKSTHARLWELELEIYSEHSLSSLSNVPSFLVIGRTNKGARDLIFELSDLFPKRTF